MPRDENMSRKTFWDAIDARFAEASIEDLRSIIRDMAYEIRPQDRRAFLARLTVPDPEDVASKEAQLYGTFVEAIPLIVAEITERLNAGESWDGDAGWDDDYEHFGAYYDDDDDDDDDVDSEIEGIQSEFLPLLDDFFLSAQDAFSRGDYSRTRKAYEGLLPLFEKENISDDGPNLVEIDSVDMPEAMAQYLRAVFETEAPATRARVICDRLEQVLRCMPHQCPRIADLIEIMSEPMKNQDVFLDELIVLLRDRDSLQSDAWLREAVAIAHGTDGLRELASREGTRRPMAYVDWLSALAAADRHEEMIVGALDALNALPNGLTIRAAIADHLCKAALALGDEGTMMMGLREGFAAKPELERLLALWEAETTHKKRTAAMRFAVQRIREAGHPKASQEDFEPGRMPFLWTDDNLEKRGFADHNLMGHALLLGRQWEDAIDLAKAARILGWSDGSSIQGLVVPFFMAWFAYDSESGLPPNVSTVWAQALSTGLWRLSLGYDAMDSPDGDELDDEPEATLGSRLGVAYRNVFSSKLPPKTQQEEIVGWCLDVACKRAQTIVSRKYRKSYHKAAALTVASAEVLKARGKPREADIFIANIRDQFSRHNAFQRELRISLRMYT